MSAAAAPPNKLVPGAVLLQRDPRAACSARAPARSTPTLTPVAAEARGAARRSSAWSGHGSSDNAASFGVYAFGLLPGWTALRDSISLSVYYGAEVDLRGSTVVALSQSGRTPDVLDYVERARSRGAFTVAVTNDARLGARRGSRGGAAARRRRGARDRRHEDLHEPGRGARAARRLRGRAGRREVRRHPRTRRAARGAAAGARARASREIADAARLRRPHVRDRPRPGVRDRARDLAEAARDVPRRRRAADRDRPRARAGRCARRAVPRLGDRLRRRDPPRRARGAACGPGRGRDVVASGTAAGSIAGAEYTLPVPAPPLPLLAPLLSVAPGQLLALGARAGEGPRSRSARSGSSKVTLAL